MKLLAIAILLIPTLSVASGATVGRLTQTDVTSRLPMNFDLEAAHPVNGVSRRMGMSGNHLNDLELIGSPLNLRQITLSMSVTDDDADLKQSIACQMILLRVCDPYWTGSTRWLDTNIPLVLGRGGTSEVRIVRDGLSIAVENNGALQAMGIHGELLVIKRLNRS